MHLKEPERYNNELSHTHISDRKSKYSFEHLSDNEIWTAFKSGNEGAFVYIYERYFDSLVNFSYQFTQDEELIKDTVQDLFIYIRSRRSNLSGTDNIKLYLYKCCRNNLLNSLKRLQKGSKMSVLENEFFQSVLSAEENIINLQTRKIKENKLKLAIDQLSAREREIIYYFYFEDLSYKEISEMLEYKEVKSVRSLLYKAVKKLRGIIIAIHGLFHFLL
ncbi:MAG: sigma-70 family RNA polymerase sigma factor [Cytophagales bacterium]|nr:sigma-70 family RNA polymerase sigma factor [Cytophagales bacterium]